MVITENCIVTLLNFIVFCLPMITDDKKPGYTVVFYTCLMTLILKFIDTWGSDIPASNEYNQAL